MLAHVPIGTGSLIDVSMDMEYPQQREDANHKEGLLGHAQIMRWPPTNGGLTQWSEYTSADPPMRRPYYREHTWIDQGSSSQSHAAAREILRGGLPTPLAQTSDVHLNSVSTGIDFQLHKPGEGFGHAKFDPQNLTFMADEGFDDMVLVNAEDTTLCPYADPGKSYKLSLTPIFSASGAYAASLKPGVYKITGRLKLPEEYGNAMLGYFKIPWRTGRSFRVVDFAPDSSFPSQEILASSTALSSGYVQGQVEWRFHLQWAPGVKRRSFHRIRILTFNIPGGIRPKLQA